MGLQGHGRKQGKGELDVQEEGWKAETKATALFQLCSQSSRWVVLIFSPWAHSASPSCPARRASPSTGAHYQAGVQPQLISDGGVGRRHWRAAHCCWCDRSWDLGVPVGKGEAGRKSVTGMKSKFPK